MSSKEAAFKFVTTIFVFIVVYLGGMAISDTFGLTKFEGLVLSFLVCLTMLTIEGMTDK